MNIRFATSFVAAVLLPALVAPAAIAADLTDVGYVDQAELANMPGVRQRESPVFAYKAQLDAQFNAAIKKRQERCGQAAHFAAVSAGVLRTNSASWSGRSFSGRSWRSRR